MGQAASYAAMAVGAGVLLSAMAIDVTDAALASAVVAAGAPEHLIESLLCFWCIAEAALIVSGFQPELLRSPAHVVPLCLVAAHTA